MPRHMHLLQRAFATNVKPTRNFNLLYNVWGANTDVGKTILSAALLKAADDPSLYIKPVQTGYPEADDGAFVKKYAADATVSTLVPIATPVSPDLAFDLAKIPPVKGKDLALLIANGVSSFDPADSSIGVVETAGGVLSPVPSGETQADFYRQFRFPALLVGDSLLGGISTTLAAYEALRIRGYDVPAIVLLPKPGSILENEQSIERNVDLEHTTVFRAPELPDAEVSLDEYFANADASSFFSNFLEHIQITSRASERAMGEMVSDAPQMLWYPFTQHQNLNKLVYIDSAYGDNYACYNPDSGVSNVTDAFGSWWTTGVGHGNVGIAKAVGNAAGRYGHVTLPGAIHENAYKVAKSVLDGPGKDWASRVFFSDNGSTAVEVALKMAFRQRRAAVRERAHLEQKIVGIEGAYHGDTLGVMDCAPQSDFNATQTPWYQPRGLFFDPPLACISDGVWTVNMPESMPSFSDGELSFASCEEMFDELRDGEEYAVFIAKALDVHLSSDRMDLGALVIEPVVQAAGGMRMIDPAFQRALVREARKRKIPVVFDEVFTGFWRLGSETGASLLGEVPDIAAYGKLMTGGTIPLSVTLATNEVFESFLGKSQKEALLHGHSYSGHAMGCAAVVEALKQYRPLMTKHAESEMNIRYWDADFAKELSSLPGVVGVTDIGTVLSIELEAKGGDGYAATGSVALQKLLLEHGVMTRPLGNVLYIMVSPVADPALCKSLQKILYSAILSIHDPAQDASL